MKQKVFVYDPTLKDEKSAVRGIGRYLQILKENFPEWTFTNQLTINNLQLAIFLNPFFNFLQKPLTIRRIAKKQIAVIHDLIPLKYPSHFPAGVRGNINIFLNKLALKKYDLIITDSNTSKQDIINILKINGEKIKVICPCLPKKFVEAGKKKLGMEARFSLPNLSSSFCLYVGDATWNKNLVNIAKAIKIADVNCVFVGKVFQSRSEDIRFERLGIPPKGEGSHWSEKRGIERLDNLWQKELKEFFELAKDDKRFIFAGFISDVELFKLYEQAYINLLLSSAEGFGFSYLEAANFSCPSLLSDIPVLKEISNNQALFADPKNPHDMADKILEIYFNQNLKNQLGAAAKKRSNFFSAKKFRDSFLLVI
ncbi:MAG: glycosyltransferase family 1 protein [Candidatus Roizmanbacteria bacterium]|nr:glycosyltransferase family 1 protein [Candidatus Roizmanbacteria bacterium]